MKQTIPVIVATLLLEAAAADAPFFWQEAHAKVSETGMISPAQRPAAPFKRSAFRMAYYIDFEKGDDANEGTSPNSAWKRHPWDPEFKGKMWSKGGLPNNFNYGGKDGVNVAFVFKGGVVYRGSLNVPDEQQTGVRTFQSAI